MRRRGEGADALLVRQDVDGDYQAEERVHQGAHHGGAHVRGRADYVVEAVDDAVEEAVYGAGPVYLYVGEVAGLEIEAREQVLHPGDELVDVAGEVVRHHHQGLHQPGQQHQEEDDHRAQGHQQGADYGERAAQPADHGPAVLREAVEHALLEELEGDVEHEGYGQAGYHHAEHAPNGANGLIDGAEILRRGVQRHREGDDKQYGAHGLPVQLQAPVPSLSAVLYL